MALGQTSLGVAGLRRLQRPHRPAVLHARMLAAPRGVTGHDGAAKAHIHPRLADRAPHPRRANQGLVRTDQRATRRARRRAHLHQPAPLRDRPSRPAARRDRRLPSTFPHASRSRLPGRGRTIDPPIRQDQIRRVPLVLRQTTPRRSLRLRRRLPPSKPLGGPTSTGRAIARGHDHPHAVRILARAWLFVIWHCWQNNTPYNPASHRALQTILNQDQQPRRLDTGLRTAPARPAAKAPSRYHHRATCRRTRSLHMTASVTVRMWRSVSWARWRPDPRHGAEPREPPDAEENPRREGLPRRFRSSTLRACGAGRLALERSLSEDFMVFGVTPNVCTRMSSRLQKLSTVPLQVLDAVMCTGPGGQHHSRARDGR